MVLALTALACPALEGQNRGRIEQAVKAVFQADNFDARVVRGLDDGANYGIQAGRITTAGEYADAFNDRHDDDSTCIARQFSFARKFDTVNRLLA